MNAGLCSKPLPNVLAIATVPARSALTNPGTPSMESPRNSSGSHQSSSTRRKITSTGSRPESVLRKTRSSRTVRSCPSTSE